MFSLLNYQHVSRKQPFITVALTGVTLSKFTPIGDGLTKLVVSRVGKEYETLVLGLLEQVSTLLPRRKHYLIWQKVDTSIKCTTRATI